MGAATTRELVVVSGYYGFDNLGDEAILEELTSELKRLAPADQIVVLSEAPAKTAAVFGVRSIDRMDIGALTTVLGQARLFVSGGGGLFQNTRSIGSVVFYGWQILLARALRVPVLVYAQGLGPLRGGLAHWITRQAFASSSVVSVRDARSKTLLDEWRIASEQTADPVWCLQQRPLPDEIRAVIDAIPSGRLIGLSLRPSEKLSSPHLDALVSAMSQTIPANAHLLLLPLQPAQDTAILQEFQNRWKAISPKSTLIDTSVLAYPSQWISLFSRCHLVIAMRLHALIMALKAGVAVVGIDYDPKVSYLLSECDQPCLNLLKEPSGAQWQQVLAGAFNDREKLARTAIKKAEGAKKLACQNFNLLARILDVQK